MSAGMKVVLWAADPVRPIEIPIMDDIGYVFFSFNCSLQGSARCVFHDGGERIQVAQEHCGTIQHGRNRRGVFHQCGLVRNLTVMMKPEQLAPWLEDAGRGLQDLMEAGGFLDVRGSGELLTASHSIEKALSVSGTSGAETLPRHPLWLEAQCLTFVSLFIESGQLRDAPRVSAASRQRVLAARDLLLSDLAQPMPLAKLASEVGLSVPTLTRGFRLVFGTSPYAVLQKERMETARARLISKNNTVLSVASELGYTNGGHFSAAFKKHFGVLPNELIRNNRTAS